MAPKKKGGFSPSTPQDARLNIVEIAQLGKFFKEMVEDSRLAKWIVLAGLGAIVEMAHILWLAGRYFFGR